MSMRFNLCSAGVLAVSAVAGLAMGGYATRQPVPDTIALSTDVTEAPDSALANPNDDMAPRTIICKGCGPTLAERRMAADLASLDSDGYVSGARDPVMVDYMRAEVAENAPPPPVQLLPAAIQRTGAVHAPPPAAVRTIGDAPPPANGRP